jgi:hypothetical protein
MSGSDLFERQIVSSGSELQIRVWAGTPWMVDAYTGSPGDERFRAITSWCREEFGPEAFPFGDDPRPGSWFTGGATVHGWTWVGFATESMMARFMERWGKQEVSA